MASEEHDTATKHSRDWQSEKPARQPGESSGDSARFLLRHADRLPRVAVIGAGPCGLAATKALLEAGLTPVCFEARGQVGGLWAFDNRSEKTPAYRSLHINTSRKRSQFTDFAMPEDAGDFPHHRHMASYLQKYARHFSLLPCIRLGHRVKSCVPLQDGGYSVVVSKRSASAASTSRESADEERYEFDALVVANGHHWSPRWPDPLPPGTFAGKQFHSRDYVDGTTPWDSRGKVAVVVGIGNSAVDIACELTKTCARVILSTRRGAWIIPKYILGRPADDGTLVPYWLPAKLRRRIVTWGFRAMFGSMPKHGLPEPDHLIGEAHPTMSDELLELVSRGAIEVRDAVCAFSGPEVQFTSGGPVHADAIVYCTGYDVTFPFFETNHIHAPGNHLPLYHRIFHPRHRNVFFIGLAQPLGAIIPIAETQARVVAEHLSGHYNLPEERQLLASIEREEGARNRRYVASPRHTMQVDPVEYAKSTVRELALGRKRSRQGRGIAFLRRRTDRVLPADASLVPLDESLPTHEAS